MRKMFARGNVHRAERDVLARRLERNPKIKVPYSLATSMIEKGENVKGKKEIANEFAEQKAMAKEHKEHPWATRKQVKKIIEDHERKKLAYA